MEVKKIEGRLLVGLIEKSGTVGIVTTFHPFSSRPNGGLSISFPFSLSHPKLRKPTEEKESAMNCISLFVKEISGINVDFMSCEETNID